MKFSIHLNRRVFVRPTNSDWGLDQTADTQTVWAFPQFV